MLQNWNLNIISETIICEMCFKEKRIMESDNYKKII